MFTILVTLQFNIKRTKTISFLIFTFFDYLFKSFSPADFRIACIF